jgi:hypothetical protein
MALQSLLLWVCFYPILSSAFQYFTLSDGSDCTVTDHCFYSPNYPSNYDVFSFCNITVEGDANLLVNAFHLESKGTTYYFDYLVVNNVYYAGTVGPYYAAVTTGSHIIFVSDSTLQYSGFEICIVPVPTFLPTHIPTSFPTVSPTPAPTMYCDRGMYATGTGSCEPCETGKYSNETSGPPFPSSCTLCAAGYIQTKTGSTECDACATGLSSEDRTECRACIAGEYARNNTECVPCESGRCA